MPKVRFKADGLESLVEAGRSLMEVCDEVGANIHFGCRHGVCGACLITVVEGELAPADDGEAETLRYIEAAANQRLACQARVGSSDAVVEPAG